MDFDRKLLGRALSKLLETPLIIVGSLYVTYHFLNVIFGVIVGRFVRVDQTTFNYTLMS